MKKTFQRRLILPVTLLAATSLLLTACGGEEFTSHDNTTDSGTDAPPVTTQDSGTDSARPEASPGDASVPDSPMVDAEFPDVTTPDSSPDAVGTAELSIKPSDSMEFGIVKPGDVSTKHFKLTNVGTSPTTDLSLLLSPAGQTAYAISNSTCPAALQPGTSCSIEIAFSPPDKQDYTAALQVLDSAVPQLEVQLHGTGGIPSLSASESMLTFQNVVEPNNQHEKKTLIVKNIGNATSGAITATLDSASGAFRVDPNSPCLGKSLPSNDTCDLVVSFEATTPGDFADTLQIGDPALQTTVQLAGTVLRDARLELSDDTVLFPAVKVGNTSTPKTITVSNSGDVDATGITPKISNATYFEITSTTCNGTLGPAASCTIETVFHPTFVGKANETLDVGWNQSSTSVSASLSGEGVDKAPELDLQPDTFSFGIVHPKAGSIPKMFTVTNRGDATAKALKFDYPKYVSVSLDSCSGNDLAPGAQCSLVVTLKSLPNAATNSFEMSVGEHSPVQATDVSQLSGNGVVKECSLFVNAGGGGIGHYSSIHEALENLPKTPAGCAIYVGPGTYKEPPPLVIPPGVMLLGTEPDNKPEIVTKWINGEPTTNTYLFELRARSVLRDIAAHFWMQGTAAISAYVVKGQSGKYAAIDNCSLACDTSKQYCRGLSLRSSSSVLVINSDIDVHSAQTTGMEVLGSASILQVKNTHVLGPDKASKMGIKGIYSTGQLRVEESKFVNVDDGIKSATTGSIYLRKTTFARYRHDAVTISSSTPGSGDLGTMGDFGNNTFDPRTQTPPTIGVNVQEVLLVQAVGNNWKPNTQHADASGHYAHDLVTGPVVAPTSGPRNYAIIASGHIQF